MLSIDFIIKEIIYCVFSFFFSFFFSNPNFPDTKTLSKYSSKLISIMKESNFIPQYLGNQTRIPSKFDHKRDGTKSCSADSFSIYRSENR